MISWDIIGWLILLAIIGFPAIGWTLQRIGRALLWVAQAEDRKLPPNKYDRWVPLWGGSTRYVNQGPDAIMVSTDANNMGGWYMSRDQWAAEVRRHKLVRI